MTDGLVIPPAEPASGTNGRRHTEASLVAAFLAGRNARTVCAYRQDLEAFRRFLQVGPACAFAQKPTVWK